MKKLFIVLMVLGMLSSKAVAEKAMEYTIKENGVTEVVVVYGDEINEYEEALRIYTRRKEQALESARLKEEALYRERDICVNRMSYAIGDPVHRMEEKIRCSKRLEKNLRNLRVRKVSFWDILDEVKRKHRR